LIQNASAEMNPPAAAHRDKAMSGSRGSAFSRKVLFGAASIIPFYVVLLVVFSLTIDGFAESRTATNIISLACVLLIVSLGQLLVVVSGGFDLSVGGVVPLSAVIFSSLAHNGHGGWMSAFGAVAAGALVGLINAFLVGAVRIGPLIATLATLSIAGGSAFLVAKGNTVSLPAKAGWLGERAVGGLAYYVFATIALIAIGTVLLRWTIFGRRLYMIGGNAEAARLAGVRVLPVLCGAYVLSGMLAAFAGIVVASQLLAAAGNIGAEYTLPSVAAVVLGGASLQGGRGSVIGTAVGVLLLGTIDQALTMLQVASYYQQVVTGVVLLAAVSFGSWQESRTAQA
jgi:ribose/xylose/arabinose/galactoside ABC-type transport system permease subunit